MLWTEVDCGSSTVIKHCVTNTKLEHNTVIDFVIPYFAIFCVVPGPSLGTWGPFGVRVLCSLPHPILLVFFEHFLTFQHSKMRHAPLVFSVPQI